MEFRHKKSLGQHFLNDEGLAAEITGMLSGKTKIVIEVGIGGGVLTKYLVHNRSIDLWAIEIDERLILGIEKTIPQMKLRIIHSDILKVRFEDHFDGDFTIIGNFPYQISTQIVFKVLEYKERIPEVVGMFQKEVAQRIASIHGNKQYGILSVLVQAYYDVDYLIELGPEKFTPPPKVRSAVIRLQKKEGLIIDYDEKALKKIVKTAFNQRRKTLRNAISSIVDDKEILKDEFFNQRAEQLSVNDFIGLTKKLFPLIQ